MGLFSGIKKIGKKIFKGVKKVFKGIGKMIGKIAGSKWGKVLLIAAAVFTGGMAIAAGFQGFAATSGTFLTKFVAGSKAFMGALMNPVGQAKEMFGAAGQATQGAKLAGAAQTSAAEGATEVLASGVAQTSGDLLLEGAAGQAAAGADAAAGLSAGAEAVGGGLEGYSVAGGLAKPTMMQQAGGMLRQGAGAAVDFAKSAGGAQILSKAVEGFAGGKAQEELLKEEERIRRYYDESWRDPSKVGQLKSAVRDIDVPSGYLSRAMRTGGSVTDEPSDHRVTLRRLQPTGA